MSIDRDNLAQASAAARRFAEQEQTGDGSAWRTLLSEHAQIAGLAQTAQSAATTLHVRVQESATFSEETRALAQAIHEMTHALKHSIANDIAAGIITQA